MTRTSLDKLKFICLKHKIAFHVLRMADHNYAIQIREERRSITQQYSTYELAKEKLDEILYLRRHNISYDEWLRGKK